MHFVCTNNHVIARECESKHESVYTVWTENKNKKPMISNNVAVELPCNNLDLRMHWKLNNIWMDLIVHIMFEFNYISF